METVLRLAIVHAGLPEPVVNHRIENEFGAFVALVDLAWPDLRVAAEYDGSHHDDPLQVLRDTDRIEAIMEAGWRHFRVNRSHMGAGRPAMLHRLALVLASRR